MNTAVQEEMRPQVSLDVRQIGILLTVASQRDTGLLLKVTKVGDCYVTGHFEEIRGEKITVHKHNENLTIESYNEKAGTIRQFKPANPSAEARFLEWVRFADGCRRENIEFGNPTDICFDRMKL